MERKERKRRIIERVGSRGPCLTEKQIANLEGMAKSPHLTGILQEMVEEGTLVVQWARHSNRQQARFFSLPEQAPCLEM